MIQTSHPQRGLHIRLIAASLSLLAATSAMAASSREPVDRLLINGEILTMDPAMPTARAVAIRGGTIAAVGTTAAVMALKGPRTEVIDLGGRTVIPGLVDTHIHAIRGGQTFTFETYWYDQTSLHGALQTLRNEAVKRGAGKWVAVMGAWHPDQFVERRAPTPTELTALLPDNPAYVQYLYDYGLVNAKAIEALGLDSGAALPAGIVVERDAQNKATGKLFGGIGPFSALFSRFGSRSDADSRESLRQFFSQLNQYGVTGLIDPAAGDFNTFNPLFSLWRDKALTVRVGYRVTSLVSSNEADWFRTTLAYMPPRFGDDMLRFVGMGEILVAGMNDGVLQARGFAPPQKARDELFKVASLAAERGYSVEAHAYTDDAANQILDAFEKVAEDHPIKDLRWTITHINSGTPATFERMRRLGVSYTVQMGPYFEAQAIREADGDAVAEASPPTRIALQKGLMVAGGTDSTRIGVINVWRAIEYQVSGRSVGGVVQRRPDYRLTREEALRLYTANAAWITSDEQLRGSLSPGKAADMAVLDAPYMRVPVDRIHDIRSVLTLVGGKVVYKAPSGTAGMLPAAAQARLASSSEQVMKAIAAMEREQ